MMLLLIIIGSYLIGSISFGLLIGKLAGIGDIRQTGSGNIGATNMLRAGGKKLALLTLLLDAGKGALAVTLTKLITNPILDNLNSQEDPFTGIAIAPLMLAPLLAALFAVIGHNYPVWLKFKGGKGVATSFGALLCLSAPELADLTFGLTGNLGVITGLSWLIVFVLTGYSSLAALATGVILILALAIAGILMPYLPIVLLDLLVLFRHRENIRRLLKGEEKKFELIKKKKDT